MRERLKGLLRRLKQPSGHRASTQPSPATESDAASDVTFRVWGCRGSIPTSGPEMLRYGGDTTCFEIACGGGRLIIDCGSGFRALGQSIAAAGDDSPIDVLLTHFHADHLLGLAFFEPLFFDTAPVTLWSDRSVEDTRRCIDAMFSPPTWPITLTERTGLLIGQLFPNVSRLEPFDVRPFRLNHPGGATGYRIEAKGRAIVIVTDHEAGDTVLDDDIVAVASGADLMVFDAPYSDAEYEKRRGWGHSPRSQALKLADAAKARRLLITHHEPSANDAALDTVSAALSRAGGSVALAKQGDVIHL